MNIKQLEKKIGRLSNPSKMPAYAWGISASKCITGTKLAKVEGTICNKCYANKNCYVFQVVKNAHKFRIKAITRPEWVDYMAELLTQKYKRLAKSRLFHRWFDSGDLQSHEHLMKIFKVCELTPHIKYWLATREYKIISKIKYKDIPKNLVVRASGIKIDGQPPKFWKWTSTVHTKKPIGHVCPAYKQDGECGSCRSCWSHSVKQVSYKEH